MNWFMSLEDARGKVERWRMDYNEFRPHSARSSDADQIYPNRALVSSYHRFFLIRSIRRKQVRVEGRNQKRPWKSP